MYCFSILGRLDRETKAVHQLTFLAETKTSPTLNSYFTLTVQVLDSNDNAPEFQSDPYDIMVSEALAPGTDVVQVQALDPDFGANGEIRYLFTQYNYLLILFCLNTHNDYWSYLTIVYLVKMESVSKIVIFSLNKLG